MATLREKFRKKKIERQVPFEKKVRRLKRKKIYVKEKCHFVKEDGTRCKQLAIGNGQLCRKHGGSKDLTNTLSLEAIKLYSKEVVVLETFDPAVHPIQMIDLSREGKSDVEIAAEMGIGVSTLLKWSEDYEPFSIAYEIAKALHETWWINKGKDGLDSRFFNTALYKFLTSNKLGYAEKTESKNMNTNVHGVLVVPAKMSCESWEAAKRVEEVVDV